MRVFISSPYRSTNGLTVQNNKARAEIRAYNAWTQGHEPFVPHTQFEWLHHYYDDSAANAIALYLCCQQIKTCDEVWVYGEETEGMAYEITFAKGLGIPIVRR